MSPARHTSDARPAGRLPAIEALRGVAAVSVVLYHVGRHIDKASGDGRYAVWTQSGHAGVDLFFVLSGFIILHVHQAEVGQPAQMRRYFRRRAVRVLPLYWIAVALTVLMVGLGGRGWPDAASLFQGLTLHPTHMEPLLGVSWTLTHEWLFYAVFGLALLHARIGVAAFVLWGLAVLADVAGCWGELGWPIAILRPYNLEFMMGMAAAMWVRRRPLPSPAMGLCLGMIVFLAGGWLEHHELLNAHGLMARLVYGPAAVLLVLAAVSAGAAPRFKAGWWLMRLGSASYAIYLFQFILIGTGWQALRLLHLDGVLAHGLIFVLLATMAICGGVGVSTWIERPLLDRLSGRRSVLIGAADRGHEFGRSEKQ